jgi:hypothetical protein
MTLSRQSDAPPWGQMIQIRVEHTSISPRSAPPCSLFVPPARVRAKHLRQPQSPPLPAVENRLDNAGRQAGERQQPTDIGGRDTRLLRQVSDRLGLTALDPAPPPAEIERTGQVSWPCDSPRGRRSSGRAVPPTGPGPTTSAPPRAVFACIRAAGCSRCPRRWPAPRCAVRSSPAPGR